MKEFRIKDVLFAHAEYSTDFQKSKYIKWNRNSKDKSITFYTDNSLQHVENDVETKIGWLLESPEITKTNYKWIENNNDKFDIVLTHHKKFLDKGENYKFCPTGGCWIKPEHQKIWDKSKDISIIASPKKMTKGHVLRHKIIYNHRDIGIYGRGYNPVDYKLTALKDYRFSITIENTKQDYYFTEKLIDCFMTGTVPVYYGCPSIGEFFNEKGIIIIDNEVDFNQIKSELTEERYNEMKPYIEENYEKAKEYLIAEDYIWEKYN